VEGADGHFTADRAGGYLLNSEGTPSTSAAPLLVGSFGTPSGSYDRAARRWLPVSRDNVRSDGLAYAYAEGYKAKPSDQLESLTRIHVVSLADGNDRVIFSGGPYAVLAYEPEGIYIVGVHYYAGESSNGLWRLDPASGAVVSISANGYFVHVGGGVGWTLDRGIQPFVLTRLDLKTGATQVWADVTNVAWLSFVGVDGSGNPFVLQSSLSGGGQPDVLVMFTSPMNGTPIANGNFSLSSITDAHGSWFSGPDGIYLYSSGTMRRVSSITSGWGYPAGACL